MARNGMTGTLSPLRHWPSPFRLQPGGGIAAGWPRIGRKPARGAAALLAAACLAALLPAAFPITLSSAGATHAPAHPKAPTPAAAKAFGRGMVSFEANRGQIDPQVRFLAQGGGATTFLTATGAVLSQGGEALRMDLAGANPNATVAGSGQLPGLTDYFNGRDPTGWHTDVPSYRQVAYRGIYPGVDMTWHGTGDRLEYDFTVAPTADPAKVELSFQGASGITIDKAGDLVISMSQGAVRELKPTAYQVVGGKHRATAASYVLEGPAGWASSSAPMTTHWPS